MTDDGHDAASVIGQMAGLGADKPKPVRVTPANLIGRFCTDRGVTKNGDKIAIGHCGYMGGRGDGMAVGFDDGYDFMGYLDERGWKSLPEFGDWPYVVWLVWAREGELALAQYCEGDLTVWNFASRAELAEFAKRITPAP